MITNCAPPPFTGDYQSISSQDWQSNLDVTLLSPVELMKRIVPGMVERGWGRVVNIGTGAAKYPAEIRILSGPPRAALVNYSVALAKAVARHNVMINNVLAGLCTIPPRSPNVMERSQRKTAPPMMREINKFVEDWHIPANKFGDADHFGSIVALFCGEQAGFVTGQSLVVDGGQSNSTF